MRRVYGVVALLFVLMLCCVPSPPGVFADGGAPNLAYVAGSIAGVSVIDVGQARVTMRISVAGDPRMILLSPDGRYLYVTQPALGQVAVMAAKTGQAVCAARLPGRPTVLALSPDATVLYAAGEGGANVSAIDPATCRVQETFKTGGPVSGMAVTAIGTFGSSSNQLWVIEPTSLAVFDARGPRLGTVPIAGRPQFLTIPNGFTAYVTTRQGTVVAVDLGSRLVTAPLLSGGTFGPMDYDELTGKVYVPDEKHNAIDVLTPIDPGQAGMARLPKEPNRIIRTGAAPMAVAITNDGLLGFVALQGGSVAMFDLIGRHLVYAVSVGGAPHFIITGLYPPSIVSTQLKVTKPQDTVEGGGVNVVFYAFGVVGVVLILLVFLLWRSRRGRGRHTRG
jgi:DNA-binding beta-propeller fold protein YncE